MLGKIDGRRRGQEKMRCLDDITDSMDMNLSKLNFTVLGDSEGQRSLVCCSPWGHRVGHDLATEYTHNVFLMNMYAAHVE